MFSIGDFQANHGSMQMEIVGEFAELNILPIDGAPRYGASSVHFDSGNELLWVGNQSGHMTSYYGAAMQKYTSFQIHPQHHPVVEVLSFDDKIVGLTKDRLQCNLKRGIPVSTFKDPDMSDAHCMVFHKDHLYIGGKDQHIIDLDLKTNVASNRMELNENETVAIFRKTSRYLCCGGFNGKIMLRDPDSLKLQHTLDGHTGSLSDFDASGHLLITCGYSQRPGSLINEPLNWSLDRFVKVYDLRMLRSLTPIQSIVQPSFLRFMSTYTRRMLVTSQSGQFLLIEDNALVTPTTPIYQTNLIGSNITSMDISPSMQAITFADSGGVLHLWSASGTPNFNKFTKDPEFASMSESLDPINISDENTPLSIIPMPYCQEPLFSDWPKPQCTPVSRRPPPIDPELLRSMKVVHGIGYAPNPGTRRRNQVPYKLKDMTSHDRKGKKAAVPESPLGRDEQPHLYMVPKKYRKVAFKYSKLGEEENEMIQHYNRTNFAGLEANIPNAYCNCMLQVLYFIEPLRCGLQSHHNLNKEIDLSEELGFLFHMQDCATSGVLQASNFLRAFRTIPEATALGLVQNSSKPEQMATGGTNNNLGHLIQNWSRFILQQIHTETLPPTNNEPEDIVLIDPNQLSIKGEVTDERSLVEKLCGTQMKIETQFRNGRTTTRSTTQFLFNLIYPLLPKPGEPVKHVPFTSVLKQTICSQVNTKSWDEVSETYQPMVQTKTPVSLPDILVLNCSLFREEDVQFWKSQSELLQKKMERKISEPNGNRRGATDRSHMTSSDAWNVFVEEEGLDLSFDRTNSVSWVPHHVSMAVDGDGELVVKSKNEENGLNMDGMVEYELFSTVVHIDDPRTGGNLVSHINVGEKYHQRKEGVTHTQWYLFNDFQISSVEKEETVDFDLRWKIPCLLVYTRVDLNNRHKLNINFPLTSDILLPTPSISKRSLRRNLMSPMEPTSPGAAMTFTPLMCDELPTHEGVLVALDAEFVTLKAEEAELHSDGTRSTIKPSHLIVARITVVRGEGTREGEPFIDDYISTQEQVVDYLTKFSGIKPGDLDASISSKHLATLKLTYCKLRYLIQCGCVIVGHGLSKDFKVINIFVPENQVRDTVHLFHMPRKRFVSLRFLSWYFLDEKIQKDMHDSIEDARTALKLYKKYLELTENETKTSDFRQTTLKQLYAEGRRLEWKVPED
nr:PAN2-PAN3 deadenylation complex catalytic subunit PAN2 isoform X1 [Ciona intestinalis]|eukprot:XP_026693869.1 PAN2-PAN3 deadenylation complex catalytic subunit PAN2 isoform X1 [Ciona intestinalis]